jgi:hypothetical protein
MLVAWMSENDTADWTVGVKFVQFRKNSSVEVECLVELSCWTEWLVSHLPSVTSG